MGLQACSRTQTHCEQYTGASKQSALVYGSVVETTGYTLQTPCVLCVEAYQVRNTPQGNATYKCLRLNFLEGGRQPHTIQFCAV